MYAALIAILPFFFLGGPGWAASLLYKNAWNLGHILFFALLTEVTRPWQRMKGWRLWLVITAVVLAAGVGIELVQSRFSREVDWRDMLRNLIGAWLVLAWRRPNLTLPVEDGIRWTVRFMAMALLVVELATVGAAAHHQFNLARQLPLVYDVEKPNPGEYWKGEVRLSREHTSRSSQSLKILLPKGSYSGATLASLPSDWRNYRLLNIDIYNPHEAGFPVTLRINDAAHDRGAGMYSDRFNEQLFLHPGHNHIPIELYEIKNAPKERSMDMDDISRLILFSGNLAEPRSLYLLSLRLER